MEIYIDKDVIWNSGTPQIIALCDVIYENQPMEHTWHQTNWWNFYTLIAVVDDGQRTRNIEMHAIF
jgi:hypothetical protein